MDPKTRVLTARIDNKFVSVPARNVPLKGASFTVSGYGSRIPTSHMVQMPGSSRWRRVYCCIYGNSGTCYVDGPKVDGVRSRIIISD